MFVFNTCNCYNETIAHVKRKVEHILREMFSSHLMITKFFVVQFLVFPRQKNKFSIFLGLVTYPSIFAKQQNKRAEIRIIFLGMKILFF